MSIADLRAHLARQDAAHDARLRAILKPPQRRLQAATAARPVWLPALPLKPLERRRAVAEQVTRDMAKRRRAH